MQAISARVEKSSADPPVRRRARRELRDFAVDLRQLGRAITGAERGLEESRAAREAAVKKAYREGLTVLEVSRTVGMPSVTETALTELAGELRDRLQALEARQPGPGGMGGRWTRLVGRIVTGVGLAAVPVTLAGGLVTAGLGAGETPARPVDRAAVVAERVELRAPGPEAGGRSIRGPPLPASVPVPGEPRLEDVLPGDTTWQLLENRLQSQENLRAASAREPPRVLNDDPAIQPLVAAQVGQVALVARGGRLVAAGEPFDPADIHPGDRLRMPTALPEPAPSPAELRARAEAWAAQTAAAAARAAAAEAKGLAEAAMGGRPELAQPALTRLEAARRHLAGAIERTDAARAQGAPPGVARRAVDATSEVAGLVRDAAEVVEDMADGLPPGEPRPTGPPPGEPRPTG
ncbi:MAG: hypothetical protein ACRDL0_15920, partial [Thermoleophilaceae bacterium]